MIAAVLTLIPIAPVLPDGPQDAPAARAVPATSTDNAIARLSLEGATLAQACAALEAASGAPVHARGEGGEPITLALEDIGFWEGVVAVCRAAGVGIAPNGTQGDAVVLGAAWDLGDVAVDGAVLVTACARGRKGDREGVLELEVRLAPGLRTVGTAPPELVQGRDFEG